MQHVLQLPGTTVSERKLKLQNILFKVLQILVSTIENGSLGMATLLLCAQKGCLRCHAKAKLTKAENVIATCNQSEPISCARVWSVESTMDLLDTVDSIWSNRMIFFRDVAFTKAYTASTVSDCMMLIAFVLEMHLSSCVGMMCNFKLQVGLPSRLDE